MTELRQGANAPVSGETVRVAFAWDVAGGADSGAVEADASAYLLTAAGKVRDDGDMVFYNQPSGAGGSVRFSGSAGSRGGFEIDLMRVPAEIERIVFCVTVHDAQAKRQTLALLNGASLSVGDVRYAPVLAGATEAAMTFGELYRRNGQWKVRAVGQGFAGGLAPLARSFGIDVAEDAPLVPPPPPLPPPAPTPVRLSKVTLDKPGQKISLEKTGASFGEIVVNLNWSRGKKGLFGSGSAIDLDLGCLFELADGRKGAVQALGNSFGSFDAAPFIMLSGDDRTGDVSGGETMRINGARWSEVKRVIVFANIYEGVPNWTQTDGVVTVTMPNQPPIEVRMTQGRDDQRLCGIVLIENKGGSFDATRIVEYFRDQKGLDERLGWGMRWVAGRK